MREVDFVGVMPGYLAKERRRRKQRFADPKIREARNKALRAFYATPEGKRKHKDRLYRRKYGTTLGEFEVLCDALKNKCEICNRKKQLVPDHNHKNGKFRGAICYQCNLGLGALEALPNLVERFQKYIQERV